MFLQVKSFSSLFFVDIFLFFSSFSRSPLGTRYRVTNGARYENNHIISLPYSPTECGIHIYGLKEEEKSQWRWEVEKKWDIQCFNQCF